MASRIVIDGNAFYEIDEECIRCQKKQQGEKTRGCVSYGEYGETAEQTARNAETGKNQDIR